MQASEVRSIILAEHEVIRGMLREIDTIAKGAITSGGDASMLRGRGRALHQKLVAHLDLEDRVLVPALRDSDGWGEERARQLSEEHQEQRELLEYILKQLGSQSRTTRVLGRTLRNFVDVMLDDMNHEESAILRGDVLRDDVVGIDVEAG